MQNFILSLFPMQNFILSLNSKLMTSMIKWTLRRTRWKANYFLMYLKILPLWTMQAITVSKLKNSNVKHMWIKNAGMGPETQKVLIFYETEEVKNYVARNNKTKGHSKVVWRCFGKGHSWKLGKIMQVYWILDIGKFYLDMAKHMRYLYWWYHLMLAADSDSGDSSSDDDSDYGKVIVTPYSWNIPFWKFCQCSVEQDYHDFSTFCHSV